MPAETAGDDDNRCHARERVLPASSSIRPAASVTSLVDKRSGRELVDAASEYGLGQYVYERFDANDTAGVRQGLLPVHCRLGATGFRQAGAAARRTVPHVTASPRDFRLSGRRVRRLPTVATMTAAAGKAGAARRDDPRDAAGRPAVRGRRVAGEPTRRPIPGPRPAGSASR